MQASHSSVLQIQPAVECDIGYCSFSPHYNFHMITYQSLKKSITIYISKQRTLKNVNICILKKVVDMFNSLLHINGIFDNHV